MKKFGLPLIAAIGAFGMAATAQQPVQPPPAVPWVDVRPIEPPATPLPPESASAGVTRFSFFAYGDTRNSGAPNVPGDGQIPNPEHSRVVDRMIERIHAGVATPFPVRFVLQTGDGVLRGPTGAMWNASFTPVVEKLTRGANIPYFFTAGNHDVTTMPAGDPGRALGLHNVLVANSKLIPPEGSARRLSGYPTYAFGFGNAFFIALDSNIAGDAIQLAWVTDQLQRLDRTRFRHVVVFFHHPVFSAGPHGGASAQPLPGSGQKAPDRVEPQTTAMRTLYLPLFRKYRVRLILTGHDHLFDHWVEWYSAGGVTYRADHLVTGGGGAPIYVYAGEPDLRAYTAAGAPDHVRVEHLMKPGLTQAENPHHFVVVQVDGDRLSLEVIGAGQTAYTPYPDARSGIELTDPPS